MKGITPIFLSGGDPLPVGLVHAKAAGLYMICTLSKHHAEQRASRTLMLDWRGYIAEATGANVFFLMKDAPCIPRSQIVF